MRALMTVALLVASFPLTAQTTNNNDSCDVGVFPAATLLLPYFEVETATPFGISTTTLFTITNTSRYPQIAHVTLWTDWGYPVFGFNIFLTGYDVQGVNLYDVIQRGIIVPSAPPGTSITTIPGVSDLSSAGHGSTPLSNTSNPNFVTSGDSDVRKTCVFLPGQYPVDLEMAVKNALTTGVVGNLPVGNAVGCGSSPIGSNHGTRAVGYLTVDLVSYCTTQFPTDRDGTYFAGPTAPLLYDNVLLGDYQIIGPTPAKSGPGTTFDAEGNAMVHIRAMPEGGLSGASGSAPVATNLPYTFYDRYTPAGARAADRRQPLPSLWAARYIEGGSSNYETDLKIWREGITTGKPDCTGINGVQNNSTVFFDIVRFDEHENSFGLSGRGTVGSPIFDTLPATSRPATTSSVFPRLGSSDVGGWLVLNLNNGSSTPVNGDLRCIPAFSAQRPGLGNCNGAAPGTAGSRTTSQNWVIVSMFGAAGANRLSVDFDAAALGNGCTPAAAAGAVIAPASHVGGSLVCPPNAKPADCSILTRPASPNP